MALAFYFVHLQDFKFQTDLTIARDKVMWRVIGYLAMGFIFDRFGTKSDTEQLHKVAGAERTDAGAARSLSGGYATKLLPFHRSDVSAVRSTTTSPIWNRRRMPRGLSLSFAIGARKTLPTCERIQRAQPALRSIYPAGTQSSLASWATRD